VGFILKERNHQMTQKKKTKYHTGHYTPKNPEKYKGNYPIVWRSSWELKFLKWVDSTPEILEYISETVFIHYFNPVKQRMARYFPDFIIKQKKKDGSIKRYLIEVKPHKETKPPVRKQGKKKATLLYEQMSWAVNQAKWKQAQIWAKKHNMEFLIITEKSLFPHRK